MITTSPISTAIPHSTSDPMSHPISTAPQHGADGSQAPFAAAFAAPVPRGLRKEADAMSWDEFLAEYAPHSGPLRLGQWTCVDPQRSATRLGAQARNYRATIAVGDRIGTATAAACGPVAALTAMLHDRGIPVELMAFHQMPAQGQTATFVRGSDGLRTEWAMGLSEDPTQSALRALIACANRLLAA
jgi:hypothetical protein